MNVLILNDILVNNDEYSKFIKSSPWHRFTHSWGKSLNLTHIQDNRDYRGIQVYGGCLGHDE